MKHFAAFMMILLVPMMLVFSLLTVGSVTSAAASGDSATNGNMTISEAVPEQYRAAVLAAGQTCKEITPGLIAAQIEAESNWDPTVRSSVGALGISQFMPGTWKSWGIDGDGDGKADILNPQDAIASQGRFMCALSEKVRQSLDAKRLAGDSIALTLAAYNAGFGNVSKYHGIPPFRETENYIRKIRGLITKYEIVALSDGAINVPAGSGGTNPQPCVYPDPTRKESRACVTARTLTFINLVRSQNLGGRGGPRMSCWDPHPWNPKSDHPKGRACDIPYSRGYATGAALAEGNQFASLLVQNANRLGIHYVIWQGRIWTAKRGWQPYRSGIYNTSSPTGGHFDHIHVSFY